MYAVEILNRQPEKIWQPLTLGDKPIIELAQNMIHRVRRTYRTRRGAEQRAHQILYKHRNKRPEVLAKVVEVIESAKALAAG